MMEAIGLLAGGIAHDFNNLLTTIYGYTELAMMKLNEAHPLYNDLDQIRLAAGRAAELVRQLLLFTRKQPMEFVPLNINKTIDGLLRMLNRLIGEDIAINTYLEPDLWAVRADRVNIEQVIMNLVVNARDAMPKGGNITIKTENITLSEEHSKFISEARPGTSVCLSVEDTGVGMDKETIQHMFEPFFTTKEPGRGTGLGLSVVYGIVKQHKGWINVYSGPGQGSTFKVYPPALSAKVEEETEETMSFQKLQGGGERIPLVEDEERIREFVMSALRENGYVVFEAADAKEAMDIFERQDGRLDLVFCDAVLPDETGLYLVHKLLFRKPELQVLMTSGYVDDKSQLSFIRQRGFRSLQKPYSLSGLLQGI
nr:response regulator [Desulfobacterales bacterium]